MKSFLVVSISSVVGIVIVILLVFSRYSKASWYLDKKERLHILLRIVAVIGVILLCTLGIYFYTRKMIL